ncbi:MAG TPA: ABC transporter permease subunit [Thermoanaerobaculia bacterium]|nr:ABC transporter permease subunit [Thermoanaerobaculia bacterium]
MRALAANIEEVFREAAARWTLVAYFALSSLFILLFAVAVNLDVVDGALAGAKIFGQSVHMGRQSVDLDRLVLGFESGFAGFLYVVGTFLAIFATAHLVPRLMEKGTVDLYLSRPVGRVPLLLSRYLGGVLLSASNLVYLLGSMWLLVVWKTHLVHPRFFLAAGLILFGIAALLAFAFLIGTLTSSTAVSIMATFAVFFLSIVLYNLHSHLAIFSSEATASLVDGLYWAFPKTVEIGRAVVGLVNGENGPIRDRGAIAVAPFLSTGLFGLVSLTLACLRFRRKDF